MEVISEQEHRKVPLEEITTEELCLVEGALRDPRWSFRSAAGINIEMKIEPERIQTVLDDSGIARQSVFKDREGRRLYAPHDQPVKIRERFEIARWILAH